MTRPLTTALFPSLLFSSLRDACGGVEQALPALYATARALASYVVPQEYGAQPDDKVRIGINIGGSMLHKARAKGLEKKATPRPPRATSHGLDVHGARPPRATSHAAAC